jgi:uncharacterized protein YndB with AHSA1/START domain
VVQPLSAVLDKLKTSTVMAKQPSELVLRLERVLPASRQAVFRACTESLELAKWWGPRGFTTPSIEIDLRVGGRYRFAMQPPDGSLFYLVGEFREIIPPSRIAYTFVWEPPAPDDRDTLVTLTFQGVEGSTTVDLTQGGFATEARLALHRQGWSESLERLREVVSPL